MASNNKSSILSNYECDGQIDLFEYLEQLNRIYPVDIRGLCDDAYCPVCGSGLDEYRHLDCERCPECHARISWEPWYRRNSKCMTELFGENWVEIIKNRLNKA